MSIAIETSVGASSGLGTSSSQASPGITTAGPSLLIAFVLMSDLSATATAISSVTSSGLTWTKRAGVTSGAESGNDTASRQIEIWYAVSSGALSSHVVTAAYGALTFGDCTIIVGSFTGTDVDSVNGGLWDGNASLPKTGVAHDTSTASLSGISTNQPSTILFFIGSSNFSGGLSPSGWTGLDHGSASPPGLVSYLIVSSVQSSITVTAGNDYDNGWCAVADAVVAAKTKADRMFLMFS